MIDIMSIDRNKLLFAKKARQQRRVLKESIHRYPLLFKPSDLRMYDATLKELYIYLGMNDLFSEFRYTAFKNPRELYKVMMLTEQIKPDVLKKQVNETLKSQIAAVDNMWKFFSGVAKLLPGTSLAGRASFLLKNDLKTLSEELNSMFGSGDASGISGIGRQVAGFGQRFAGALSNRGTVKESLSSTIGDVASGAGGLAASGATAMAANAVSTSLMKLIDDRKAGDNSDSAILKAAFKNYGIRPIVNFAMQAARKYGMPYVVSLLSNLLGPAANAVIALLGVGGAAVGAGVLAAGAVAGVGAKVFGTRALESRAKKIEDLRQEQKPFQDLIDLVATEPRITDFTILQHQIDNIKKTYPSFNFNMEQAKTTYKNYATFQTAFKTADNSLKSLYFEHE